MNLSALCRGEPVNFPSGLHGRLARETYDNIPALSCTVLKKWIELGPIPSEFKFWMDRRWEEPCSEAKLLGSALDCTLLESDLFDEKFAVVPPDAPSKPSDRLRKAKKPSPDTLKAIAWWDDFAKRAEGKQVLTYAQCTSCLWMKFALEKAPSVQGVFEHCRKIVLVGELFGLPCKAEFDLWNERIAHILDLKTALDVSPAGFASAMVKFGYVEQASFYLLLAQACGFEDKRIFSFVAVKNAEPWTVKVHSFAPFDDLDHFALFEAARKRLALAASNIVQRLEKNDFSDSQDWDLVRFPAWTIRQANAESLSMEAAA